MLTNGATKTQRPDISPATSLGQTSLRSSLTAASASYLSSCSKVAFDAYEREAQKLQSIEEEERTTEEIVRRKAEREEQQEKERTRREHAAKVRVAAEVAQQIRDRVEGELKNRVREREEYNAVLKDISPEVVAAFPKIVELPTSVQREIVRARQIDMRAALETQMAFTCDKRRLERSESQNEERMRVQREETEIRREDEAAAGKRREKMERYREELDRDIKFREMRRLNEKRLGSIESQGMITLRKMVEPTENPAPTAKADAEKTVCKKDEEQESIKDATDSKPTEEKKDSPSAAEDASPIIEDKDLALIEEHFSKASQVEGSASPPENHASARNSVISSPHTRTLPVTARNLSLLSPIASPDPRLTQLLEKKQRRTNELLAQISSLEKKARSGSRQSIALTRMRIALSREGFRFRSQGRSVRISGEEVTRRSDGSRRSRSVVSRGSVKSACSRRTIQEEVKSSVAPHGCKREQFATSDRVLAPNVQKVAYDRYLSELEMQVRSPHSENGIGERGAETDPGDPEEGARDPRHVAKAGATRKTAS